MKLIFLKIGILIFFYTTILSIHLENSYYYYIKGFKGERSGYGNNLTKIDNQTSSIFQIPVKKYLTKEEYSIVKDLPFVPNNTKIVFLPFEANKSLFLSLFWIISITIIICSLNFKAYFKSSTILGIILVSLFIQPIYTKINKESETPKITDFEDKIQNLENGFGNRINDLESRIDDIENNLDY